jgi:hypothetical protein
MFSLLFALLGMYGFFASIIGISKIKEANDFKMKYALLVLTGIVAFSVSIVLTGMYIERKNPTPIKASEFKGRTEIITTYVNGQETSRDTLYIFSPKK